MLLICALSSANVEISAVPPAKEEVWMAKKIKDKVQIIVQNMLSLEELVPY